MDKLHLNIVTPCQEVFNGCVDSVLVRTTDGDVSILPRHIDYAASLGLGFGRIRANGNVQTMRIEGGLLSVRENCVRILANRFEWSH